MTDPQAPRISFRKEGDAEVADLGAIGTLDVDLEFQQDQGRGFGAKLAARFKPADPDLTVIAFAGAMPTDAADPKNKTAILNGAVVHHGDARGAGVETVTLNLGRIAANDRDITGFALVAANPAGFARTPGAVARIYDVTTGTRVWLDNVRFNIVGSHTSALLGVLRLTPGGWQFRKVAAYGQAVAWQQMASLATAQMR